MRTLEEIDRDLEIAYADMRNFIHSGFSISPVLEDDIDELRDERAAVVKAIQDAGLMRYEVCILPKPENTSSYCAAFYKITATSQNQAFEHGKETFIRGFANCGVTAENFDAEYDIGVTRGEKIEYFYPRPLRGGRQQKQRQNLYFQTNYTTFCTNLEEP